MKIGFIGQGWIGRHYADDFERRGYDVVRYALEAPYAANKELLKECAYVFIAVPTPTTPDGFSMDILANVLTLLAPGTVAVIKSTLLPGRTNVLQAQFPKLTVMHSPEFLVEATAAHDAANPQRNIIGITVNNPETLQKAEQVLALLPPAPFQTIVSATEAEIIKYAGNCFLATKVVFMNMLFDYVAATGGNWEHVKEAMTADPRIGASHMNPHHQSGRGAGGHCFIKDYEAWIQSYAALVGDSEGVQALKALRDKNVSLLTTSGKDLDLLEGVYGKSRVS